ncbi:MAG: class I SAM-dependent methyltransferase [Nitrospinae bacterium]|nr:class I SAM-dependent methyltransferase [Nitrospinota bacterium]
MGGFKVKPIEMLKDLNPKDVVLICSEAVSTDLYESILQIQSICPNKVIHSKQLMDVFLLHEELKEPLNYEFGHFLFGSAFFPMDNEYPYWHPIPPNIDFKNKTILELGPFEGNNSIMIMEQEPKKVIGLEVRPLHFAKTAVTKSLYNWSNYSLILGDMHLFPNYINEKLDIIYCSGVLYHSAKPWWLLKTCMDYCDTIILSTYVSSEYSPKPREFQKITLESGTYDFEIFPEPGHLIYDLKGYSLWFKEKDLIQFVDYYGFKYERYQSAVQHSTGLWVFSLVTKK